MGIEFLFHSFGLIRHIAVFTRFPAFYLRDLAGDFHTFYNADRVLVDDEKLKLARLALLSATRQVLQNGLRVLGVSAPAKM